MKKLNLRGSASEIGRQHGEQGKDEIHVSLSTYERLFYDYQGIDWNTVKERAKIHIRAIESFDESLLEEMQGVADGAGLVFEDILALNARSEIALTGNAHTSFSDGCTSFSTCSPLTEDTIIGQNWDWKGTQKDSLLMLNIEREDRPNILMITEGGIIGKIGCNENALGVGLNALHSTKKTDGVPIHLGLRSILDSSSLHEAMGKIQEGQMASAANFMIGYSEGKHRGLAFHVEVSPFGIAITNEEASHGVHTNHICSQEIQMKVGEGNNLRYSDSEIRKRRAEQLIQQAITNQTKITDETFREWLRDTFNAPNSINHYVNEQAPVHRRMETVFGIVMNLTTNDIYVCDGMPAHQPFEKFSVSTGGKENVHQR
ncbi:C45 family autoproteolytic acyltransferase/hydolase [Alteribacillus iranensis]|uniref:Isopenicillin-N N-acyltransferase like protein n=1 Tax=Alteribacillus iranensis TaxID=930128 RepID=A0A1I2E1R8_9BACI|nr:C45 family peptidase [Alteribacillus iranensis]SFE86649.1 isopenicillin-N N-acyltransferase like protein [Alteribacillus iranensis]